MTMSFKATTEMSRCVAVLGTPNPKSIPNQLRLCKCKWGSGSNKLLSLALASEASWTRHAVAKSKSESSGSASTGGGFTYKDAGVDIDAGSELVKRIAKMAPGIGGFGGLYPLGMIHNLCL